MQEKSANLDLDLRFLERDLDLLRRDLERDLLFLEDDLDLRFLKNIEKQIADSAADSQHLQQCVN